MTDYFTIQLPDDQIRGISSIGLAHIGDGVYELLVRTWLCAHGKATGRGLHRATVELVCAPKQAALSEKILPLLTEEEQRGARKTLTAAALTYVAATAVALSQLLRLLVLFGGRRKND